MEKTYTCSSCQGTFTVPLAKVQASYGWMACPVCNLVAQFDESFVSQHRTVSFVLSSLDKNQQTKPLAQTDTSAVPVASSGKQAFVDAAGPKSNLKEGMQNTAPLSTTTPMATAAMTATIPTTMNRLPTDAIHATTITLPLYGVTKRPSSVRYSIWWQMWCWVGVGALSFFLLVSIGVIWDRNWVAARWPVTKPWLQAVCDTLDCQIQPYRSLENLDILSSSLQLLHYDSKDYILEFVLANRSKTLVLAAPTLTLKLLRPDGKLLLQKTLTKQDIPDYPDTLLPGVQWEGRINLHLDIEGNNPQQVSFELTSLYPETPEAQ